MFASAQDLQRLAPPSTPHTQMLKAHFEQQNMQMMENLSEQNQRQIQDLAVTVQTTAVSGLLNGANVQEVSSQPTPVDNQAAICTGPTQSGLRAPSATYPTGSNRTIGYFYAIGSVCYQKRAKRNQRLSLCHYIYHQNDGIPTSCSSTLAATSI